MKKGIYIGCFPPEMSVEDRFELAAAAGFDAIEMQGDAELIESDEKLERLAGLARRTLPISCVMGGAGWRPSLTSNDPEERARALHLFRQTIRAARALNADGVLVVPGVVNEQVNYQVAWDRSQAALHELARAAEEHGICLCVENVWNKFLLIPLEMCRFVDEIAHPLVQVYFDVGNVLAFGYPEQWIAILGKRIRKVHLKDFKTQVGTLPGFVQLLEGDVDWPAVMAALRQVGYDGYLTAEVAPYRYLARKGILDLASSIDALRTLPAG